MDRSDVLYIIIGNNSMPNLVSIATRINYEGEVVCFYTESTRNIFSQLKNIFEKKSKEKNLDINMKGLEIKDINDITEVREQLEEKIILDNSKKVIELNFTGGTKVLSATAFEVFKNKAKDFSGKAILSYFDGENEVVNSLIINGQANEFYETIKYKKLVDNDILNITAKDIVELHNAEGKIEINEAELILPELSNKIYKEVIVNREHGLNFLYKIEKCLRSIEQKKWKSEFETILENILKDEELLFFKTKEDFFVDGKRFNDMNKKEKEIFTKCFMGFWLEHYIASVLLELKEEGLVDNVFSSVKKKLDKKDVFEVDLMVYNNFSLKCISVTIIETYDEARFKLYEVKTRANQLSGDETKIAYINLCENSDVFSGEYKKMWQEELEDVLIISYNNLANCKELIKNWVNKGEI